MIANQAAITRSFLVWGLGILLKLAFTAVLLAAQPLRRECTRSSAAPMAVNHNREAS